MTIHNALQTLLVGLLCVAWSLSSPAQTSLPATARKPPASEIPASPAKKKQTSGPFHGKLKALNLDAKSITMGTRTFYTSSATKITKHGKPAMLKDGVVGETVSGFFQTAEGGQMVLKSLRFGPKVAEEETPKKKSSAER